MAWKLTDNFKGRRNHVGHKGKTGKAHPCWKGGQVIDRDGYIRTWAPNHPWPRKGYMMEHVRVVEIAIGRRITSKECVHHKDHNRTNNALENLEVMSRSEHSKMHRQDDANKFIRGSSGRFVSKCGST